MLDGIWEVYLPDGSHLGTFETRIGNEVLMIDEATAAHIAIGDVLHLDETHTKRAWEVRIKEHYRNRPTEFVIEKLSDREAQYPRR